MAATVTSSLVFIDDVTADISSRMNSVVYRSLLSAQVQPNASKLIGRKCILQQDNGHIYMHTVMLLLSIL
uniref:Uncharacterized protein n=1 Tax=Anguilla anguilla TaxID=7936 RepID=A0A0E9XB48_ANGAN